MTRLHCRRCNQQIKAGDQFTSGRTHDQRIAVHYLCPEPAVSDRTAGLPAPGSSRLSADTISDQRSYPA